MTFFEKTWRMVFFKTTPAGGSQSFNSIFPTTVSPWDLRTTSGGSSGGSAAALASYQCWLATGTDLGGSVRQPAAHCGVVGFRVSPGRTPANGFGPLLGAAFDQWTHGKERPRCCALLGCNGIQCGLGALGTSQFQ